MKTDSIRILITFSTTRFRELRATWKAFDASSRSGELTAFGTTRLDEEYCGGRVVIVNWATKFVEREVAVNRAGGALPWENRFLVGAYDKILWLDQDLNVRERIDDHRFNNIHGLCRNPEGIAVASTGIDSILYLDSSLSVTGHWCAVEHGFKKDPRGKIRQLDMSVDHRRLMYPTLLHTTHVNSLHWVEDSPEPSIYAVLFHQGTVQKVVRESGKHQIVIDGLSAPHAVGQLSSKDWIVANSACNQAITWKGERPNQRSDTVYFAGCDWVQDVKPNRVGTGYFVADCNGCRIAETNESGRTIGEWRYPEDWKVQEVHLV